jgi:hypothetical protein
MFWHKPQIPEKPLCVSDAESLRKYVASQKVPTSDLLCINLEDTILASKDVDDDSIHRKRPKSPTSINKAASPYEDVEVTDYLSRQGKDEHVPN